MVSDSQSDQWRPVHATRVLDLSGGKVLSHVRYMINDYDIELVNVHGKSLRKL